MKFKPSQKYVAVFELSRNGKLKISKARKLVADNTDHTKWKQINARDFARAINTSKLIIN